MRLVQNFISSQICFHRTNIYLSIHLSFSRHKCLRHVHGNTQQTKKISIQFRIITFNAVTYKKQKKNKKNWGTNTGVCQCNSILGEHIMYNILDGILRITFEDNNNNSVGKHLLGRTDPIKNINKWADWRKAEKKRKTRENKKENKRRKKHWARADRETSRDGIATGSRCTNTTLINLGIQKRWSIYRITMLSSAFRNGYRRTASGTQQQSADRSRKN